MTKQSLISTNNATKGVFLLTVIVFLCCTWACNDTATTNGPQAAVVGTVNQRTPLRLETAEQEKVKPALSLRMAEAEVKKGGKVCLPVEATGLTNLLGFQFTMRFDSAALTFDSFRATNLPGYSTSNFGDRFADRGYLSTLWSDPTLKSTSMPAGHKIFEVCFTSMLEKGAETEVKFADGPTFFEVVGVGMESRRLVYANGKVRGK